MIEKLVQDVREGKTENRKQRFEVAILENTFRLPGMEDLCRICGGKGHPVWQCPERTGERWAPAQVQCDICGEITHITKDCKYYKKGKSIQELKSEVNSMIRNVDEEYQSFISDLYGDGLMGTNFNLNSNNISHKNKLALEFNMPVSDGTLHANSNNKTNTGDNNNNSQSNINSSNPKLPPPSHPPITRHFNPAFGVIPHPGYSNYNSHSSHHQSHHTPHDPNYKPPPPPPPPPGVPPSKKKQQQQQQQQQGQNNNNNNGNTNDNNNNEGGLNEGGQGQQQQTSQQQYQQQQQQQQTGYGQAPPPPPPPAMHGYYGGYAAPGHHMPPPGYAPYPGAPHPGMAPPPPYGMGVGMPGHPYVTPHMMPHYGMPGTGQNGYGN